MEEKRGNRTVTPAMKLPAVIEGMTPPALVVAARASAPASASLEFFAPAIRNPHTRRAYARAAGDFPGGACPCAGHLLPSRAPDTPAFPACDHPWPLTDDQSIAPCGRGNVKHG
jgi:hypothetical protein